MYFCKNCGEVYQTDEAVMCVKCGVGKGKGSNYCHNCGRPLNPDQTICLSCGAAGRPAAGTGAKSRIAAGLLGIFLGSLGIHNFYLGNTRTAVIQLVCTIVGMLLSCAGIGVLVVMGIYIWGLVEGIFILCGRIDTDGQGNPLAD